VDKEMNCGNRAFPEPSLYALRDTGEKKTKNNAVSLVATNFTAERLRSEKSLFSHHFVVQSCAT
jgi:hypothetical protein